MVKQIGKTGKHSKLKSKVSQAKKMVHLEKQVKHLVKLETNAIVWDEFSPSTDTPTSSGTVVYLHPKIGEILGSAAKLPANLTSFGTDLNTTYRCVYRTLHLKMQLTGISGVQYSPGAAIRVIVFQDMANEAALPGVSSILATSTFLSDYNRAYKKRYKVLKDRTFTFNSTASTVIAAVSTLTPHVKNVDMRIKLARNRTIEYDGNAGTVADAQIGQLFILYICDAIVTPTIQYNSILSWEAI